MRTMSACRWLVLAALVVVLLSRSVVRADDDSVPYRYIPVLNIVALSDADGGCAYTAEQLCRASGSYLPGDVSVNIHTKIAEVAGAARSGTWYSFLAADTFVDENYMTQRNSSITLPPCPRALGDPYSTINDQSRFSTPWCIWRWRSGRWLDVTDINYATKPTDLESQNLNIYAKGPGYGVSFAYGNSFSTAGPIGDQFPYYFNAGGVTPTSNNCGSSKNCASRPGTATAKQLMAVGEGSKFTWTDTNVQGGYVYQRLGLPFGEALTSSTTATLLAPSSSVISEQLTMCIMYAPARYDKELYNTSSQLQNLWWVIYLVILFVICLVIFIVAVCCQEREDMDEPPEDAPEWADQEARSTQKPKRVVSQRSFRQQPDDDDYYSDGDKYEELDEGDSGNPLAGRRSSGSVSWQ